LGRELGKLAAGVGGYAPDHVAIGMQKHSDDLRAERTQRTRVLLFTAMAGAVAQLVGRDRVRLYENGVIALHLPIAGQLVGARVTRTAHPRTLAGLSRIL